MSANWSISRNSSDRSPVLSDLMPQFGTVTFSAGQVTAVISLNIVADVQPEEAEAFVLKLLPHTVTGNAEIDEPMEVSFVPTLVKRHIHVLCMHVAPNVSYRCKLATWSRKRFLGVLLCSVGVPLMWPNQNKAETEGMLCMWGNSVFFFKHG